jgi:hypothetical protein
MIDDTSKPSILEDEVTMGTDVERNEELYEDDGCDSHHFEEYQLRDGYKANIVRQFRHFDETYVETGVWKSVNSTLRRKVSGPIDERMVITVKQKEVATCEHHRCYEKHERFTEVDSIVFEEQLNSSESVREEWQEKMENDDDG